MKIYPYKIFRYWGYVYVFSMQQWKWMKELFGIAEGEETQDVEEKA